ncbi:hypothetical protein [Streptomyces sp. NPDC048473]|uniref:hypothetical protein n=1 Tax=unclassified Streptomyces TaxID=2593676 RepID=UPI00371D692D
MVAVVCTLLGTIVAGLFQHKSAGRAERAATAEQLRRDRLDAVTTLAAAGFDHRRALWMRGEARLRGEPEVRLEELRSASHITRSAITRPLVAVHILVTDPDVRASAQAMVVATNDMHDADTSIKALTAAQSTARTAHDTFVDAAAAYLAIP